MQRVLIIENHLLIGAGVQILLANQPNLEVAGISPIQKSELVSGVKRFEPDVIVIGEGNHLWYLNQLLPLLNKLHRFRILVISADADIVGIYDKQETPAENASQLVSLIQNAQLP